MSSNEGVKETLSRTITDETLSSEILSDINLIAYIYKIIKTAASYAVNSESVKKLSNKTCIIKLTESINTKGHKIYIGKNSTRTSNRCIDSESYKVEYNPDDIAIVGGSAITLYDNKISRLRERKELKKLQEYIIKKTSDIDIVWWPRIENQEVIITSSSSGIKELVNKFRDELQKEFDKNKEGIFEKIKSINGFNNATSLEIYVLYDEYDRYPYVHYPKGGNHNLSIQFNILNQSLKICDIIIHDSGASQNINWDGQRIRDLTPMNKDPMYIRPKSSKQIDYESNIDTSINHLDIDSVKIAVPNIELLIKQQLFAFKNFIRRVKDLTEINKTNQNKKPKGAKIMDINDYLRKALINLQRVQFLKLIIDNISISNENNIENFSKLVNTSTSTIEELDISIENLLNNVITTTKDNISKIKAVKNDEYLNMIIRDLDIIESSINQFKIAINSSKSVQEQLSILALELFKVRQYLSNASITNIEKRKYKKIERQILEKQSEVANIHRKNAIVHLEEHRKLQDKIKDAVKYKQDVINRIQYIINMLRGIENMGNRLDIDYKKKVQETKSGYIKEIVKLKETEPIDLLNRKSEIDEKVFKIESVGNQLEKNIIFKYGFINSATKAIWMGDGWLNPKTVDPKTLSIWMGDGWIKPNYVDERGYIWTGYMWLPPGSISLHDKQIWTGHSWVRPGEADRESGDFWTGAYWVKSGTVNSATGQLWDGRRWFIYDHIIKKWFPIQETKMYGGRVLETRKNKNRFNKTRRL
jgi:hypothetical protein